MKIIQPEGFPPARGYANGALCEGGATLYIAGQVAWDGEGRIVSEDFVAQFDQALGNVLAVLEAAGGRPTDLAKMTVYVTDLDAYRSATRELSARWRARLGRHYPAMALVGVAGLVDPSARVEIEAVAHLSTPRETA